MKRRMAIVTLVLWIGCIFAGWFYNWARGEMGFPSVASARELASVRNLYGAGLYDAALTECLKVENERAYRSISPQLAYTAWMSNRRMNQPEEAGRLMSDFLSRYPSNPLGADMLFAAAMDRMAAGEYSQADQRLVDIEARYHNPALSAKINDLREKLRNASAEQLLSGSNQ